MSFDRTETTNRDAPPILWLPVILAAASLMSGYTSPEQPGFEQPRGWPLHSFDYFNSNSNPHEREISARNVRFLRRKWQTFNDSGLVPGGAPTGFALETALGLVFPATVVGVVGSPLIVGDTIYYVDALGTLFARAAKTGAIVDPNRHWTRTLVDPDFEGAPEPVAPDLYYAAPVVTQDHVWLVGAVNGKLHAVERAGGREVDFDTSTPAVDPFTLIRDMKFASVLGEAIVVDDGSRKLYVTGITVILNDAIVQDREGGVLIAIDITDPAHPREAWRTFSIDTDASGRRLGTGVSMGSGLAFDAKRGLLIGGTGQNTSEPYPGYPDPHQAPAGYVDRGDSLFAIDVHTGRFVWSNQFHRGDVFDINAPVSTGPDRPDGPRDADVLSPPILFSARKGLLRRRDLAACGSKGGLFRAVDRQTGETIWERQISKPTGIGGIQAGAAVADGVVYVAGFEGLDDGFSDAQFGVSLETGKFPNAFFATFSPQFWSDVEYTKDDGDPSTGMRIKVYALNASNGRSLWRRPGGSDFVELKAGAAMRHVSVANGLVYVTTTSGQLFVLDAQSGSILFRDQTLDLNNQFDFASRRLAGRNARGIAAKNWQSRAAYVKRPHHAGMAAGTLIADGLVVAGYGLQNNPSGGVITYTLNHAPIARDDYFDRRGGERSAMRALENDSDPDGDALAFSRVAGRDIEVADGHPDVFETPFGQLTVVNPGDSGSEATGAFVSLLPSRSAPRVLRIPYLAVDLAPLRVENGRPVRRLEPTHTARTSKPASMVIRLK